MTRFLVACSGGPDSVALVRALKNTNFSSSNSFVIAHVNHKLRGRQSEKDAQFVKSLAKSVGWPCVVVRRPVRHHKGNLEENARNARYAALEKIARQTHCKVVLTAHTLEDQAETIFMNLLRGSGPDGLSGIWPIRKKKHGTILIGRPFLTISKSDILAFLRRGPYKYRKDRSNNDKGFLRNWLRHDIFPKLEKRMPGFKKRVAQLGNLMRDEHQYWDNQLLGLRPKLLKMGSQGAFLDFKRLLSYSDAVQRRFLRAELGGDILNFEAVEKLRRWMSGPPTGGRHWQLRHGWMVERMSRSQGAPSASVFLLRKSKEKTQNS